MLQTAGHMRQTAGHMRQTAGHMRQTAGHMRQTAGHMLQTASFHYGNMLASAELRKENLFLGLLYLWLQSSVNKQIIHRHSPSITMLSLYGDKNLIQTRGRFR